MRRTRGFTLIELLVVISIIGMLSSIVLVSLNSARGKAIKAQGLASGKSLLSLIAQCDIDGGKLTTPNSPTNPTNSLCTTGVGGPWPKLPSEWVYYTYVWIGQDSQDDRNNLMRFDRATNVSEQVYCGYYPDWSAGCSASHPGFCRCSTSYCCTYNANASTGSWE